LKEINKANQQDAEITVVYNTLISKPLRS